jgi:hypothetical protein
MLIYIYIVLYIMKGGENCDPCSEKNRESDKAILKSLEETKALMVKREKSCPGGKGPSLKAVGTTVLAANKFKKIGAKKYEDPTHWHLYENDSGKYWENGDETEAFWVSDVGNIVPLGWTVTKALDREDGLYYFGKDGASRWYLTTDEIGEAKLDESKKWRKAKDKNGRAFWKKHTNPYLWEVRWVKPEKEWEKQIAKEYKVGNETKYEKDMTRANIDTWVQNWSGTPPPDMARLAAKLRSSISIRQRNSIRPRKTRRKKEFAQKIVGGKRRSLFKKKRRTKKRTKSLFKKKRTKKRTKSLFKKRTKKRKSRKKRRRKN